MQRSIGGVHAKQFNYIIEERIACITQLDQPTLLTHILQEKNQTTRVTSIRKPHRWFTLHNNDYSRIKFTSKFILKNKTEIKTQIYKY